MSDNEIDLLRTIHSLEKENLGLRDDNGFLNRKIEHLEDIIKKYQNTIDALTNKEMIK